MLVLAWLGLCAASPRPLELPVPNLVPLVPWVTAPLDKPALQIAWPPLPLPPLALSAPSPSPELVGSLRRPTAPLRRGQPCATWLGGATDRLACARAQLARSQWAEAAPTLEALVRATGDAATRLEALYWLAEAYDRLGRVVEAEELFGQVAAAPAADDLRPWALHGRGWAALRRGDAERARAIFAELLGAPRPDALARGARAGLGLSLAALGRFDAALEVWHRLEAEPAALSPAGDLAPWYADALRRTGRVDDAVALLGPLASAPRTPAVTAALVQLGWWGLEAGRADAALAAFRTVLAPPPGGGLDPTTRAAAEAGLALTLVATGDWSAALPHLARLDGLRSPLGPPVRMRVAAAALAHRQGALAAELAHELLATSAAPLVRGWALLLKGDALRAQGDDDGARAQYELVRGLEGARALEADAAIRLARLDVELRDFRRALRELAVLRATELPPALRVTALLLEGEAAYQVGDWPTAREAYRRLLVEFPADPQAAVAHLALAWALLRAGDRAAAQAEFLAVARRYPASPAAGDALLLAAELALQDGDLVHARDLLERTLTVARTSRRAEFAWLNRGLLLARTGRLEEAERELDIWVARNPTSPVVGWALAALGLTRLARGAPAEAAPALARAEREGAGDVATLGLGFAALAQGRLEEAAQSLERVRHGGPLALASLAEYGLAAVALARRDARGARHAAEAALAADPRGPLAPRLLYVLATLAAREGDWVAALRAARRLADDFPEHDAADDALADVGRAAAEAGVPGVASEAYALLRSRYPTSPFAVDPPAMGGETPRSRGGGREAWEPLLRHADPRVAAEAALAIGHAYAAEHDHAAAAEYYLSAAYLVPDGVLGWRGLLYAGLSLAAQRERAAAAVLYRKLLARADLPAELAQAARQALAALER